MKLGTEKHYERDFVCALKRSELIGWLTDKDYSETTTKHYSWKTEVRFKPVWSTKKSFVDSLWFEMSLRIRSHSWADLLTLTNSQIASLACCD